MGALLRIDMFNPPVKMFEDAEFFNVGKKEDDWNLGGKDFMHQFYAHEDQRQADKKDAQLHEEAAIIERKAKQVAEEEENELDRAREIEKYGLRARMWQKYGFCPLPLCQRPSEFGNLSEMTPRERKAVRDRKKAEQAATENNKDAHSRKYTEAVEPIPEGSEESGGDDRLVPHYNFHK